MSVAITGRRVSAGLNQALHDLFAGDDRLFLLGEDVVDPYGGAFGVTRGLSTAYPDRVLGTPISEGGITGVAAGLALCGDRAIVEVMFGDFITLCVDPLVNFISKSVTMYGRRLPMGVVVRCPVGGNRGYGPTHSQNLQKLLFGVPNLQLLELSPLHDPRRTLDRALAGGEPAVFFEDKVLYTTPEYRAGRIDNCLRFAPVDESWMLVDADDGPADWVVIAPGGLVPRLLPAMRAALVDDEVLTRALVPDRLWPLDLDPVLPVVGDATRVLVVEDGPAGGGWAAEVTRVLYERLWGRLRHPVRILQPPCAVIPAATHLERDLLLQSEIIYRILAGGDDG
ncbi:alpha-ketoacid dehydrogenase subunit beta [Plantactinospora sp. S1510]|uniref:Pyruvate dehydrogenase E1 component subunit beta n=1 Tax=Plantactinospora alkalitolerans TaxID=2789879 RepID=A0ABS0H2W0_9ACTN|nr:transketolase C-terminal domain-containing protein [Plantactinospora alkalitolerans]MBF9132806.1 alpha-ketoacid dehydrogenase subunit beta [Plantactinospora alkalitolerans]